MAPRVLVDIRDGVADVRLHRPDKINALDPEMFVEIAEAGERLKREASLRAVVLSGEGRGFCAGIDFTAFREAVGTPLKDGPLAEVLKTDGRITHRGQQAAWVWTELEVPVVAAIHGPCFGAGLQIALGADIRLVDPAASLAVMEVRWGIVPDMAASLTLPHLVGLDVAKELYWTGRTVSGHDAARLGLATRCEEDPRAAALNLAAELARQSPDVLRAGKRLLTGTGERSVARQLELERQEVTALLGGANQVEAVEAFFAKREPVYRDPGSPS
ncbi:enoyl-CoA hydratase [Frankia sp. CcI49]|uniref:crotonase/enoyl-CoA hydratase family protein n=1 Tax=unclassified Frankia TaxID=2632575 RepID=UPI0006C9FDDD|nr:MULTISPECIES: crotonase/enoyl-CoA hydratase family protein [unclassified Frankia]KPM51987.1 enoyl-CoA hydratase [Frankia sp. R43]ONH58949.1 enoyl-CoA hydratase [Frankia sp. CcI49]